MLASTIPIQDLSTRSDEHTYKDLVIRNNGMRVLHAFHTRELLGWGVTSPFGRISFSGHGADKMI